MRLNLTLALIFLISCARTPIKHTPVHEDLAQIDLNKIEQDDPASRVLVEAQKSDEQITAEVGKDLDEDLPVIKKEIEHNEFLKPKMTKRVRFWINYFTKDQKERFQRFLNNGQQYRPLIEKILEQEGVPKDLYYVGLIESGYYLKAKSHASAVGPWQFIKGTAKRYKLYVSYDVDERKDIFKATRAAAQYFKDLHNIFSSWELALAAYNKGEFGIVRRITRYKTRDYYELSKLKALPSETINYVPKVLAVKHIVENASSYGFKLPSSSTDWVNSKLIQASKYTSLYKLAKRLGVSYKDIRSLNPELRYKRTPKYFPGTYYIRVPGKNGVNDISGRLLAQSRTSKIRKANRAKVSKRSKYHRVRRGENLSRIARKYRVSVRSLKRRNNLRSSLIKIGQKLAIPGRGKSYRPIAYYVKRGDNLSVLASWFNTSIRRIMKANKMRSKRIYVGQKLVIPNTKKGTYTVRNGDYIIKIAQKFKLHKKALMRLNSLKTSRVYPGQKLIVNLE